MKGAFLSRFTPSLMPPEALEAVFVRREREARRTVELVRESALTANKSHTLFVGPRGIGKTHLVSLIYHRLRVMDDLQDRLLIAWLREEEWGVSSFLDILQRVLRALAEDDPALAPRLADVQAAGTEAAAERVARDLLREIVGERTLLLLAENLDDLFDGIGDEGQKRFRAFLQDTRFTTILATSQGLFTGVSRQAAPFYNFFRVQHLPGLSLDEAVLLLTKIAELEVDAPLASFLHTPAGRARVRAVHHLAGGSPRVYVIFSEFLTRDALDELVAPFLKMLDELTPYYQSKMRSLSPQQRKIIEILSDARGAIPVKEIAARSFLTHQTVSSQLQELREKGYATAHKIGRESFYELQEPLMRLCLEVKKQRGEPITLFVDFLRLWCTREDLERRLSLLPADAMLTRWHLREALHLSKNERSPLVLACLEDLKLFVDQDDYEKALQVGEELVAIRGEAADWTLKGLALNKLKRFEEALTAIDKALQLDVADAFVDAFAWKTKAQALDGLHRYEEALVALQQAIAVDPKDVWPYRMKGLHFLQLERYEEAVAATNQALLISSVDAPAYFIKAMSLYNLGQDQAALTALEQTQALDPTAPSIQRLRGRILDALGRYEEAITAYEQHLKFDLTDSETWASEGDALYNLERYEESVVSYEQALMLDPANAGAWVDKGDALYYLGRDEEALAAFEQAVGLDPLDTQALHGKARALHCLERYEDALASYNQAISLNSENPSSQIHLNRIQTLFASGRWGEALTAQEELLPQLQDNSERFSDVAEEAISWMLAGDQANWQARAETLATLYGRHGSSLILGQALSVIIPELTSPRLSPAARRLWQETWQTAAGDGAELRLPLRLMDTAIRYQDSGDPPDPRILLELPVEERSILESLLGVSESGTRP